MGFSLSNFLNPFSSKNPLRPDNFMKTSVKLAKNPFSKTAQHASYGDFDYDPQADEKAILAAGSPNGDGTFSTPINGYQRAMNSFILNGAPGTNGAAVGSSAWNNAFNAWAGKAMELNGAYDAADANGGDPLDLWSDNWDFEAVSDVLYGDDVPLEQDLMDRVLSDYVYPGLEKDKANQAEFAKLLESYKPVFDANNRLVSDLSIEDGDTGHSILATQELKNLDEALAASLAATDEREASKYTDLDAALAEILAANDTRQSEKLGYLEPLLQSRLDGAESQVVAASLGEQKARDQIAANMAAQGYIGGSSFADANLARATIDARQTGAQAVADAKQANALDVLDVNNEFANSKYDTTNWGASQRLGIGNEASDSIWDAKNWGANQKLAYLDADTKRRLSNLETPFTLVNDQVDLTTKLDRAGWANLDKGLDTLKWWKLSEADGGGTVSAAPNTVDTSGNWASAIGPSLVNAGLSIGQANNWWQTKKTT